MLSRRVSLLLGPILLGLVLASQPAAEAGGAITVKSRKVATNKRPGVIATLGPATGSINKIRGLLRAKVDIARINMSHNNARTTKAMVKLLRAAARKEGKNVPLLFDLPGGKVRLTALDGERFDISEGTRFTLSTERGTKTTKKIAGVGYPGMEKFVKRGSRLLLDDGKIELRVTSVRGTRISTRVVRGGEIRSRMGIAIKDLELPFPAMTPQDRRKLKIAVDNGADWIGVSLVQNARNVKAVRRALKKMGATHVKVVAKIESKSGMANLEEIMAHSDLIMIARGDLEAAVGRKNLARAQASIAARARKKGVQFIVATGLMSNMLTKPAPSAANRRDVRRAVKQEANYLMINESGISRFAVEAAEAVQAELDSSK